MAAISINTDESLTISDDMIVLIQDPDGPLFQVKLPVSAVIAAILKESVHLRIFNNVPRGRISKSLGERCQDIFNKRWPLKLEKL